jgi:long-chain fatty acid transport protein
LQAEYMSVDLTSATPTGTKFFDVDGDDINVGFTAGLLFQPTPTTDIGLGFRSSVKHKLQGDGFILGRFNGDISADFSTPELVSIGVRQKITSDLTLMAGAEWANWSRFDELNIKADANDATIGLTVEDWKDSWFVSAGAEYAFNEQLLLRAGVAYEKSPVPDATRTPRVPDNDRIWLAAGASYAFNEKTTLTFAYSHIFMEDGDVNLAAGGGLPSLSASFDQSIDIVSASFRRDW